MTEIKNNINSDFLNEKPNQSISNYGLRSILPDRWKGWSTEQLFDLKKEQLKQIEEKTYLNRMKRLENEEFERNLLIKDKLRTKLENELNREKKNLEIVLVKENKKLVKEQNGKQNTIKQEPSMAFFAQFNTNSR
jgi:hypothetical protein